MAKIYGNLERASLEVLASAPTVGVTGRVYWDSVLLKAQVDNSVAFRAFLVNDTKCILGNSGTAADNIRLHRGAAGVLQLVSGADATAEGSLSTALNQLSSRVENYATGSLPAAANAGRLLWDTSLSLLKVDTGAAIKQILHADGIQVVTNKDIDGGTASNTSRLAVPKDTYTNLNALTRKEAVLVYASDQQKLYFDNGSILKAVGSGSGSGQINYIAANPDAEVDTTGWATYADAANPRPVDGTGGSPTVTWTRSTSSPLRNLANFLFTKDAANRQGEGVSYDFTIDSADQAKMIDISFDYEIGSGTYDPGTSSTDSDLIVYIRRTTAVAANIEPVPFKIQGSVVGTKYNFMGQFQSDPDATGYRLILHVATTSASAWTMKIDNVVVSPSVLQISGGETGVVAARADKSATQSINDATDTKVTWTSLSYDTHTAFDVVTNERFVAPVSGKYSVKVGLVFDVSATGQRNATVYKNGVANSILFNVASNSAASVTIASGSTDLELNAGDYIEIFASQNSGGALNIGSASVEQNYVCIHRISGPEGVSSDALVLAVASLSGNNSPSGDDPIIYDTELRDTHAAYNPATGEFTVPVAGDYEVSAAAYSSATALHIIAYLNGVAQAYLTEFAANSLQSGKYILPNLVAGDVLHVGNLTGTATYNGSAAPYTNYVSFKKV